MNNNPLEEKIQNFSSTFKSISNEISKLIVGQEELLESTLACIVAEGHALLEGAPGLGKTLLVKSIATVLGLHFKRIQFTPDLMPSDVTGTEVLSEVDGKRQFNFREGPLFSNIVLADEINRTTPKTQAALLEAMGERQVTVLGETRKLPNPFFVLATQNPIELEGTYPLPEAQLDRFLVKLLVPTPKPEELKSILTRTTGNELPQVQTLFSYEDGVTTIKQMQALVREVHISDPLLEVIVRIVTALSPDGVRAPKLVSQYIRFGPGPRGAQGLTMLAKVFALLDGRINLSFEDIKKAMLPTLRHRLILNFQAETDNVTADSILNEIKNAK